jgi:hypothetical protein
MRRRATTMALLAMAIFLLGQARPATGADHGDAPGIAHDQSTDIGDVYFFLDPNDNSKAILAFDNHGFIVPSENANLGFFDSTLRYRFEIENTGDAVGDRFIDVTFSKQTSRTTAQTATITIANNALLPLPVTFTAPTTVSSATGDAAPAAVVTTDPASGIKFFAGLVDDPFFFDIPAELRYRASRFANAPDPSFYARARDSFAGYNILMIALSVPKELLQQAVLGNQASTIIGVSAQVQRLGPNLKAVPEQKRGPALSDSQAPRAFTNADRMGIPAVNTVFVGSRPSGAPGCAALDPNEAGLAKKDRYNRSAPSDDAAGAFADDIVKNLQCLRTGADAIAFFAGAAVTTGDYLRLDLTKPNASNGVPTTPGTFPPGGFGDLIDFKGGKIPNGRRPGDDVIDVIVTGVNNFQPVGSPGGCTLNPTAFCVDRLDKNDRDFLPAFPFFAPPNQPLPSGGVDKTQN